MKNTLFLFALVFAIMACKQENKPAQASENTEATTEVQNITVADLKAKMAGSSQPFILDVRTPAEVAQGIIEGATVIDINDPAFMDKVNALDKNAPTVVYCKVGGRSATACSVMKEMGFKELYNLEGGYDAWKMQQ